MAEQENIKVAREEVDAFSAKDWNRYRAVMTPDTVYDEKGTQRRVQGVEQVIAVSQGWTQAFPDAKGTVGTAVASGDTVVLEITWEGTQTGPLQGPGGTIPPSGKRAIVPAVQVLQLEGGKIKEMRHYFDLMGMLQQLGAGTAPG